MKDLLTLIFDSKNLEKLTPNFTKNVALIYTIENDILRRSHSHFSAKMLGISDFNFSISKNLRKILTDILFEYKKYNFEAIYLNFSSEITREFVFELDKLCFSENIKLYVPFSFAKVVTYANLVLNTAICGGNLKNLFEFSILEYGINRISAEISCVAREFEIPSSNVEGVAIEIPIEPKNVYFSDNLYTNYFTTMKTPEVCVFTIFDNQTSIARKIDMIASLKVCEIFLNYNFIVE